MEYELEVLATPECFDEAGYLASNADLARAVADGMFASGAEHFNIFGKNEGRKQYDFGGALGAAKKQKLARVAPLLRDDIPHVKLDQSYDFLSAELRSMFNIIDTENVSSNNYDPRIKDLIASLDEGLILDCGAGKRNVYYSNVVNFEIADYVTTDVRGVGEVLPFKDNSFDAVISIAVLEHVKDPFLCAKEIARVLKPGGQLICSVPFLQPLHGYPHHYYNMSGQGLNNLFNAYLEIDKTEVWKSMRPIWLLTWFVSSWADGLEQKTKEDFLNMPLKDFLNSGLDHLDKPYVKELSEEKNMELACATVITAHKRIPPVSATVSVTRRAALAFRSLVATCQELLRKR